MATLAEKHDGDFAMAAESRDQVRLWLRLLSCAMIVDKKLRSMLSTDFDSTLPRFDVLAALERAPDGLTMGQLSRALLVSNGNVTALVQTLVKDGLARTVPSSTDRRQSIVQLTPAGRHSFIAQADRHHTMIAQLFGGLDPEQVQALYALLGQLKLSIAATGEPT